MEFLQLCIPAWDVVSPPSSVLRMAPVNRFRWSCYIFRFLQFSSAFFLNEILASLLFCSSSLGTVFYLPVTYPAWWQEALVCGHFLPAVVPHDGQLFGHIVCCNGDVWATCSSSGSRVVGVWLIWAVEWYHLIGDDTVFHFVSFRVKIRVSPAGIVAVEVSHYDPSFPFRLDGVEMEHFWE